MKFGKMVISNYCTYTNLEFDFNNLGLALLNGATGSGKSTVLDMACWILYGRTAKGTAAEEVRPWGECQDATSGFISVNTSSGDIEIRRTRGKSPKDNDLFWFEENGETACRGKDNTETQGLLEKRLGVPYDLYVTGAYFHEFSPAGNFFLSNAKAKREVMEDVADMTLAYRLECATREAKSAAKKHLASGESALLKSETELQQTKKFIARTMVDSEQWVNKHTSSLSDMKNRSESFETDKLAKLDSEWKKFYAWEQNRKEVIRIKSESQKTSKKFLLPDDHFVAALARLDETEKCVTCGALSEESRTKREELLEARSENRLLAKAIDKGTENLKEEKDKLNPHEAVMERIKQERNVYAERLLQLQLETNPHINALAQLNQDAVGQELQVMDAKKSVEALKSRLASLSRLYDLSFALRGRILQNTVSQIQDMTNNYLEKYFDSEFIVNFTINDGDNLEVAIQKSGNDCSYQQLSKGQRQLLKLTFAVSLMQIANQSSGEGFQNIFMDEALDGLDVNLKVKAFDLFQELSKSYDSVLLIDHAPEFQNLFDKRFHVELVGDHSQLSEES